MKTVTIIFVGILLLIALGFYGIMQWTAGQKKELLGPASAWSQNALRQNPNKFLALAKSELGDIVEKCIAEEAGITAQLEDARQTLAVETRLVGAFTEQERLLSGLLLSAQSQGQWPVQFEGRDFDEASLAREIDRFARAARISKQRIEVARATLELLPSRAEKIRALCVEAMESLSALPRRFPQTLSDRDIANLKAAIDHIRVSSEGFQEEILSSADIHSSQPTSNESP